MSRWIPFLTLFLSRWLTNSVAAYVPSHLSAISTRSATPSIKANHLLAPRQVSGVAFASQRPTGSTYSTTMPMPSSLSMGRSNFAPPTPSTENTYSTLLERPVLATLDAASLLIFASVGKASHSANGSIDPLAVVVTVLPFLIAWLGTAPLLGLYNYDATHDLDTTMTRAAKGWIIAVPLGIALRGISKGYIPPTSFAIVTMISTLILLGGVRAAYSTIEQKLDA